FLLVLSSIGISQSAQQLENTFEPYHGKENYCYCGLVDGKPDGWDPKGIWVDIYIIFDTSVSMADHLDEAKSMVTSFVSQMNTNRTSRIHSRIGVIEATRIPKVIYNLNMKSTDNLNKIKLTSDTNAHFDAALLSAIRSFSSDDNLDHQIATVVQEVVFYLTNTDTDLKFENSIYFKSHGGIIIVNDFGSEGATENAGLKALASDNFYFTDLSKNPVRTLELLCEANCYCDYKYHAFNDDDVNLRTRANRGCYEYSGGCTVCTHSSHAEASTYCSRMGATRFPVQGSLVSIHDQQKEFFVNSVASDFATKDQYWIALKNNGTAWNWEDQSTDPFSDWADDQPNTNDGQAMCAYAVQTTGFNTNWFAADCDQQLNVMCETAPCSVEYLCMPRPGGTW
ncbi:hypothetical protein PENTCL1PPCAC_3630, partial [Pristionchus entomophagus]